MSSNARCASGVRPLVLFDGVCALCNASVNFIVDRDRARRFQFEPLQSPRGQSLLSRHHLNPSTLQSVVLIEAGRVYLRSTAALRICKDLGWPWTLLAALVVIPAPIRDEVYDWIAAIDTGGLEKPKSQHAVSRGLMNEHFLTSND